MAKTYLYVDPSHNDPLPAEFQDNDSRFPDALVEYFLNEFTNPGDQVFDPFAGFGTTLRVAERMGRHGYGIELDPDRHAFARSQLQHPERLLLGDSRQLASYTLPLFDFSITSPPFRPESEHNPLTAYQKPGNGYQSFLWDIGAIYAQLAALLRPGGVAVIKVSNLKTEAGVTTLAWDLAKAVSRVLHFDGERILCWDRERNGYHHSYALVFRKVDA